MKKMILGLGALTAVITPVAISAQCGGASKKAASVEQPVNTPKIPDDTNPGDAPKTPVDTTPVNNPGGNVQEQQVKNVDAVVVASVQTTPSKKLVITVTPAIGSGKKLDSEMIKDAINKLPGVTNCEMDIDSFTTISFVVNGHTVDAIDHNAISELIKSTQISNGILITNYSEFKTLANKITNITRPGSRNFIKGEYNNAGVIIFGENTTYYSSDGVNVPRDISANSKDEFLWVISERSGTEYSLASTGLGGHNGNASLADDKIYFSQTGQENNKRVVTFYFKDNWSHNIKSTVSVDSVVQKLVAFAKASNEIKSSFVA